MRHDHAVALLGSATPLIVMPAALTAEQLRVPLVTSLMPVEAFASGDKTGWTYSWDLFYDEQQQAADAARALATAPRRQEGRAVHRRRAGQRGGAAAVRGRVQGRRPGRGRRLHLPGRDDGLLLVHRRRQGQRGAAGGGAAGPGRRRRAAEATDVVRVPPEGGLPGRDVGRRLPAALARPHSPRARCRRATGAPARRRLDSSPSSAPRSARSTPAARTTPRPRSATRWPRC